MSLTLFVIERSPGDYRNEKSPFAHTPGATIVTRQVIRAKTRVAARILASAAHGDEGPDVWLTPKYTGVRMLTVKGAEEVICLESERTWEWE